MKLCDTCIYRSNVEQLKPCIIYRDNCEYYEREEDMKAIIQIDVPNYQIWQEVSIYFKDTMMIKGIVQEPSETIHGSTYGGVSWGGTYKPQEPKIGHWIEVTNGRGGHECDMCHNYAPCFQNGDEYLSAFCRNCGVKMR